MHGVRLDRGARGASELLERAGALAAAVAARARCALPGRRVGDGARRARAGDGRRAARAPAQRAAARRATVAALRRRRAGDGARCRCERSPRSGRCAAGGCARSSRRRVADATGGDARDVLQPALARASATRRARGCCCTARPRGAGGFRVSHHAIARGDRRGDGTRRRRRGSVAHYPASEGVSSTQILGARAAASAARCADVVETLPAGAARAERLPDRARALAAMHFRRDAREARARAPPARLRGAALDAARARCPPRARASARAGAIALARAGS